MSIAQAFCELVTYACCLWRPGRLPASHNNLVLPEYKDIASTNVFITGGGAGISAYFVAAFALQEARVGFVSLAEDPAGDLCDRVVSLCGLHPEFYPCDIRDIASLKDCMSKFQKQNGAIEVLANNAARDARHNVSSRKTTVTGEDIAQATCFLLPAH